MNTEFGRGFIWGLVFGGLLVHVMMLLVLVVTWR